MASRIKHSPSMVDTPYELERFNALLEKFDITREVGVVEFSETYLATKYATVKSWRGKKQIGIQNSSKMLALVWDELLRRDIDQDVLLAILDREFRSLECDNASDGDPDVN